MDDHRTPVVLEAQEAPLSPIKCEAKGNRFASTSVWIKYLQSKSLNLRCVEKSRLTCSQTL